MKNKKMILGIAFVVIFTLSIASCSGKNSGGIGGGGKSLNSAEDLKAYLDKQPANSPDKPIRVTMAANGPMLPKIAEAINSAGKYVSLNLSGNLLTTIPDEAFYECETLVNITIPNSVTSIERRAFSGCTSLTSINIPASVTSIEGGAFSNCTSLTSITIPNSVTSIGGAAFGGCTRLTSITIPNSVTSIGGWAFHDCTSLASITIPNSVTSIGEEAFEKCTGLTSITIPKSVTTIERWAFSDCTSLTSVTFEGTIASGNLGTNVPAGWMSPFDGDLRAKYLAGGIGTYKTTAPVEYNSKWTKQ